MPKKFWGILVLVFFINFIALPSIAVLFSIDVPQTGISINGEEEEQHSHSPIFSHEKALPKVLNVMDFMTMRSGYLSERKSFSFEETVPISPHLSIFSPPPERVKV